MVAFQSSKAKKSMWKPKKNTKGKQSGGGPNLKNLKKKRAKSYLLDDGEERVFENGFNRIWFESGLDESASNDDLGIFNAVAKILIGHKNGANATGDVEFDYRRQKNGRTFGETVVHEVIGEGEDVNGLEFDCHSVLDGKVPVKVLIKRVRNEQDKVLANGDQRPSHRYDVKLNFSYSGKEGVGVRVGIYVSLPFKTTI